MTRIPVDALDSQEDRLQFGDPIDCAYHWLPPGKVDAYGDSVRRLSAKVELATDAFQRTATISEESFAGEAADTLRGRAEKRYEESVLVRDNLRGLGRAVNAYADVLRQHRDGLEQLRSFASGQALHIRGNSIVAPVATIAGDAPPRQIAAWEAQWKSYQQCFDLKIELRDTRRVGTRDLVRALAEFADVHPDKDKQRHVAANSNKVKFGELRQEAAAEARDAIQARAHVDEARRLVVDLRRRELASLDSLKDMVDQERPVEEIRAQSAQVATLRQELGDAQVEAREAEIVAHREQAESNQAARRLADAEAGRPSLHPASVPTAPMPTPPVPPPSLPNTVMAAEDSPNPAFNPKPNLDERLG